MRTRVRVLGTLVVVAALVALAVAVPGASAQTQTQTPTSAATGTATTAAPTGTRTMTPTEAATPSGTATETPSGLQTPTAAPVPEDVVRTITVTGVGQATAAPDQVILRLGVQTQADTAADAFADNNTTTQAVVDALVEAGVAEENIQTQAISLQPQYEQPEQPSTLPVPVPVPTGDIVGYVATNIVQVRVADLEAAGDVLDAAIEAGANVVQSVQFVLADSSTVLNDAREAAFEDARQKAEQLAELAGEDLGPVRSIDDFSRPPVSAAPLQDAGGAGTLSMQPGMEIIEVSLQVTWLLQ